MRSRSLAALWSWRWLPNGLIAALAAFAILSSASAAPPSTGGRGTKPAQPKAALALTGSPLAPGYVLRPDVIDFGDVPFDERRSKSFCIINTGSTDIQIRTPLSIVPAAGTMDGELSVVRIRQPAECGGTSTQDLALPQTLTSGQLLEVTVRAAPANRVGLMQATLTLNSDLSTDPVRTLSLRANSIADAITITPGSTVDFGGVDVQGPPAAQTIKIINTSGEMLQLKNFRRANDSDIEFEFDLVLPGDTMLPPDHSVSIPVTYKPLLAAPPGSERTVNLLFTIVGLANGPVEGMIDIRGRGIDRVLALGPPPMFPDTFRNPGDQAPVRAVTVRNLGEATLKVSAVMVNAPDDAWQVVDAAPADIPKDASHDFFVRFTPTATGPAQAKLVIMNDDSDRTMAEVDLVGMGIHRNVQLGPDVIRLGYTGVGVPITTDDALVVTSQDPDNTFQIRAIELDQDSQFQVEGLTRGLELAPMAERTFGITFTAQEAGAFSVKVRLFLDTDPEVQQEVTLEGTAVFVSAHGGGGCAAGGSRGPAGGALLVLAALLGLRRFGEVLRRQRAR
ncbi:MAG TPA: choice-of-anchor D domain-containing protein [Kofleriaceae bacterium]|nr:choice-of-anchor D domain-containing protein [Kofleriaceae bacterium]